MLKINLSPNSLVNKKMFNFFKSFWFIGVFTILFLGILISNFFLIQQNRDLKAALSKNQSDYLKPGQQLPAFVGFNHFGEQATIDYANSDKTILLVFAHGCVACERTVPYWREIEKACRRNQYRIFALTLGDESKSNSFLASNELNLELFSRISSEIKQAYKLSLTPLTIVVDSNSKVEKIWVGAFNEETKSDLESYFGFSREDLTRVNR